MRRRLAFLSLGVACAALGVWSACNDYDDATEIPAPDAATSDVVTSSSSSSSSSSSGGVADASDDEDARDGSAVADADAALGCVNPCDCDNDTYVKKSCYDASSDAGFDCDDNDEQRHPGQGYVADKTDDGDWNCNDTVEKETGLFGACGSLAGCANPVPKFLADVACGQKADGYICKADTLAICTKTLSGTVTQRCR